MAFGGIAIVAFAVAFIVTRRRLRQAREDLRYAVIALAAYEVTLKRLERRVRGLEDDVRLGVLN